MSERMKVGTILELPPDRDHGDYGIVTRVDGRGGVELHTSGGWHAYYNTSNGLDLRIIGRIIVGKPYAVGTNGRRFRRCHIETADGQRSAPHVMVREDADDAEETSVPAIRLQAFCQWAQEQSA